MTSLPKFNFKSLDLSDEQLNEQLEKDNKGGEGKFFRPGLHETQIVSSVHKGPASDPTWAKWIVKYEGTGGKTITDMLFVPSSKVTFTDKKGEENTFATRKLKNFIEAVGGEFKLATLGDVLSSYFGKEDALKGMNVAIKVAYPGTHVKFLGSKRYTLAYRSGDVLEGAPEFESFDDAVAYGEEKGIEVKRFAEVDKYEPSATGNSKKSDNW